MFLGNLCYIVSMAQKPTLNQADIELLKGIFATKDDLVAMEKRQDTKYATKADLTSMEQRLEKQIKRNRKEIKLVRETLNYVIDDSEKLEQRLVRVENQFRLPPIS